MNSKYKTYFFRGGIYAVGLILLSMGITLSTKTGLGVSSITSVPYAISHAFDLNFSVMTFLIYAFFVAVQFVIKGKNRRWLDLLQLPVSIAFSGFLQWFGALIPLQFDALWQNMIMMVFAILFTGVGISMMVNMEIVPIPPDGLTQAMSVAMKKDMGFAKNLLDLGCVAVALTVDLMFSKALISVGIGTILSMIFIGRVVAVFGRHFREPMRKLAGFEQAA